MKTFGRRAQGARLERMRASPRWAGNGFRNVHPVLPGLRDPFADMPSLQDFLKGVQRGVPAGPLPADNPLSVWRKPVRDEMRATWLGHSTVLIEMDGIRVLTDPVWGKRASPSSFAGPKRFQPVPVAIKALPPLDAVIISHDHYDHLCYASVHELNRRGVLFVTSLGVGAHLQGWGVPVERIVELDWWESHRLAGSEVEITAAPSQHFSGRSINDRNATLWSSMVVRSAQHAVFFSGDTGLTTEYETIRERLGPFDLVMLEVGAWHPAWGDIHLGPDNALRAHAMLGGGPFLPIHWGTFRLAMHAWDQPIEALYGQQQVRDPLLLPRIGQPVVPARGLANEPWWRQVDTMAPARSRRPEAAVSEDLPWPID